MGGADGQERTEPLLQERYHVVCDRDRAMIAQCIQ
jgi:hypothetical protein